MCIVRTQHCIQNSREINKILPGVMMSVCCESCVLWYTGLCDRVAETSIGQQESYRLRCVVVCELETSWMKTPWPACSRTGTLAIVLSIIWKVVLSISLSILNNSFLIFYKLAFNIASSFLAHTAFLCATDVDNLGLFISLLQLYWLHDA